MLLHSSISVFLTYSNCVKVYLVGLVLCNRIYLVGLVLAAFYSFFPLFTGGNSLPVANRLVKCFYHEQNL